MTPEHAPGPPAPRAATLPEIVVLPSLASEELLARMLESIVYLDAELRVRYLNPAAEAHLGRMLAEVQGRTLWEEWPVLAGTELERQSRRAMSERVDVHFDHHFVDDVRDLHLEIHAYPAGDGLALVLRDVTSQTLALRETQQATTRVAEILESMTDVVAGSDDISAGDGSLITSSRDVTDRRRAIELLRSSEARYRALVDASTLMVWSTDASGMVDDMPFWREITGQTREEVRGMGWSNAIHPDDAARAAEAWQKAVATRSSYEAQYRLRLKDGSHQWYRARAVPILDASGAVREWVGVFNEIDRMVRREEAMRFLAEASAALTESLDERSTLDTLARLAVDYLADGCMITLPGADGAWDHVATRSRDDDVTAAYAAETESMYPLPANAPSGYPRAIRTGEAELVPPDAFDERILRTIATDATHLERVRKLDMYSAMVIPLVARGDVLGAITLVLHGPSRRRPFDASDLALATELGRRAALAVDNARLFAAERAARATAERGAELTRRLQRITASFARTMTIDEVADITLSRGLEELSAIAGAVYRLDAERRAIETVRYRGIPEAHMAPFARIPIDAELRVVEVLRTGEIIYVEDRSKEPNQDFAGTPTGYGSEAWAVVPLLHDGVPLGSIALGFGTVRDFTSEDRILVEALGTQCAQAMERARLLESERMARRDAESANQAKSELLAKVSHETRQPVHATVGWAETLAMEIQGPINESQREALRRIQQNQGRLLAVLNDLLDMSRIEAGKLDLRITDVVLAHVVDAVESAVAPQMQARDIAYDFCHPPAELVARADHGQLVGILTNLLSNAAKFTPSGGQVSVDCRREGGKIVLAVCDTGIGIDPELHERVFEPFFQVDVGFTRTTVGTGLGLAISREAARAMGGELTLSSAPGDGSIFSIWLPAAR